MFGENERGGIYNGYKPENKGEIKLCLVLFTCCFSSVLYAHK